MNVSTPELIENERQLAVSLWRCGQYSEAREVLRLALGRAVNTQERIALTINLAQVERAAGKPEASLAALREVADTVENYFDPRVKGRYFNTLGAAYYDLGGDFVDKAFEAYTAASIWYERAKELRMRADVENNIALLMIGTKHFEEAHEHLNTALVGCNDETVHAQIDETRARAFLASGNLQEALECALSSAVALKDAGDRRILFESLETLSHIYAELKREDERRQITHALEAVGGNIKLAAGMLGLSRQALYWKLEHQYQDLLPLRTAKKRPRGRYVRRADYLG